MFPRNVQDRNEISIPSVLGIQYWERERERDRLSLILIARATPLSFSLNIPKKKARELARKFRNLNVNTLRRCLRFLRAVYVFMLRLKYARY